MKQATAPTKQTANATPVAVQTSPSDAVALAPPTYGVDLADVSFDTPIIQPKMTIHPPDDKYEREADRLSEMALQRMSMSRTAPSIQRMPLEEEEGNRIQRKCATCEQEEKIQPKRLPALQVKETIQRKCSTCNHEEQLQTKLNTSAPSAASVDLTSHIQNSKGKGSPLSDNTRASYEAAFGSDFSGVRVHTDNQAIQMNRELGARAFTTGRDIYFNRGEYQPSSVQGKRLLGHELVHVVQQGSGNSKALTLQRKKVKANVKGIEELSKRNKKLVFRVWQRYNKNEHAFACKNQNEIGYQDGRCIDVKKGQEVTIKKKGVRGSWSQIDPIEGKYKNILFVFLDFNVESPKQKRKKPKKTTKRKKKKRSKFKGVCGPDVTYQVKQALKLTRTKLKGWSKKEKESRCESLISLKSGLTAWEIDELHNQHWLNRYRPECVKGGKGEKSNSCERSVWVENGCYYPGSVNYVLYGVMNRLCFDHYVSSKGGTSKIYEFSLPRMLNWIYLYKGTPLHYGANFRDSQRWAIAGWKRWPSGRYAYTPKPDRKECAPCKLNYFDGRKPGRLEVSPKGKYKRIGTGEFSVHWGSSPEKTYEANKKGKSEGWFGGSTWEPDPKDYGFGE